MDKGKSGARVAIGVAVCTSMAVATKEPVWL